jgi:hypothetical protein
MDPNQDDEPLEESADDEEPRASNALPLQRNGKDFLFKSDMSKGRDARSCKVAN